ncbi:uncharacterized protein LOC127746792 isoform X3 [Arachis duranensis]|uniref:Uncharacterized protein LOC127746792 isoform X3 n=1 Tax=Arachis duranensis TaxID=130453 RepID=A0A9C6TIP4_ARADU|nr:uncharacterized protein LOC127746792 isoform X3 [Arachis duranensis]
MNGPIFWGLQGLTQRPITFPRPLWWRRYSCCKPAITLKELPICQSCQPASPCLHTMTTCRSGTQAEGIMESLRWASLAGNDDCYLRNWEIKAHSSIARRQKLCSSLFTFIYTTITICHSFEEIS